MTARTTASSDAQQGRLPARLAVVPVRHPRLVLLVGLLLALTAIAGIARLGFSTDYRIFFDPDGPRRAAQHHRGICS